MNILLAPSLHIVDIHVRKASLRVIHGPFPSCCSSRSHLLNVASVVAWLLLHHLLRVDPLFLLCDLLIPRSIILLLLELHQIFLFDLQSLLLVVGINVVHLKHCFVLTI